MVPEKETILKMLSNLKEAKVATSKVEKDLGFSNGLLKKGKLSQDKFDKLNNYYQGITGKFVIPTNISDSLGDLKDKVVPASEVPIPEFNLKDFGNDKDGLLKNSQPKDKFSDINAEWVAQVEEFCNSNGITALELIEGYKSKAKGKKSQNSASNEGIGHKKERPSMGNWRKDFIKAKTGYSPTD